MLRRILLGAFVTALIMAGTKYVDSTPTGKDIERLIFASLQRLFPSFSSDLPIIVVDMSKTPRGKDQVTSREALKQTLTAIVAQKPAAVGIDLDFSPTTNDWQSPDDSKFFKYCLQLREESKVPIYLGVGRGMGSPAREWLGLEQYKTMAAALRAEEDTMRLPQWIQSKDTNDRLPLMSAALASNIERAHKDLATGISHTVPVFTSGEDHVEVRGENDVPFGSSLVNYSRLPQIQRETSFMLDPKAIAESGKIFRDKVVLIGDVTDSDSHDHFYVPGHTEPIPGVFLIASATYTLAIEPLYEPNPTTCRVVDLLISILIFGGIEFLRFRYVNKVEGTRFEKKKGQFIVILIAFIWAFGLFLVIGLNIFWFDFPFVTLAIVLHPKVEELFHDLWKNLRGKTVSKGKAHSTE
jgi:CHASE2 domain-containing sensor protein